MKRNNNPRLYKNGMLIKKYCSQCKMYLDVDLFSNNKSSKDGLHHHCKKCKSNLSKKARLNPNIRIKEIFSGMKNRCLNKHNHKYHRYGGRGIEICDKWLKDVDSFYKWSISNGYENDLTIDRINNNGNYEPNNCRWVSTSDQNRNSSLVKLNINKASSIRSMFHDGIPPDIISLLFGIATITVRQLCNPNNYRFSSWRSNEWDGESLI